MRNQSRWLCLLKDSYPQNAFLQKGVKTFEGRRKDPFEIPLYAEGPSKFSRQVLRHEKKPSDPFHWILVG